MEDLPTDIKVERCPSLFRYLGMSQGECKSLRDRLVRGFLAGISKIFGRTAAIRLMLHSQNVLSEEYDYAISYLHNGRKHSFYGGVNEFVLEKIKAKKKIAFLHCDYEKSGSDQEENNRLYYRFDRIAACSDGCRESFIRVLPELGNKCVTVRNCHNFQLIRQLADTDAVEFSKGTFDIVCVARLSHEKGLDRAIKAVSYGVQQGYPLELHIIGGGKLYNNLVEAAKNEGVEDKVHFYGEQYDPYRFIRGADLLLITSYQEAAPMIIEEAASLGLPVLSTETSSSREMITEENCGWVCDNSQDAINRQLIYILDSKEEYQDVREGLTGRAFDNSKALRQFKELLSEDHGSGADKTE